MLEASPILTRAINLRRKDASQYLNDVWGLRRAPSTLAVIACRRSDGPKMVYHGRTCLYPIAALDAYAREILSSPVRSTSERKEGLEASRKAKAAVESVQPRVAAAV